MLQTQGRLVDERARVRHRQRAPRLHQLRQVGPLDVLHREDQQVADLNRRVGAHDVGVGEPGRRADLAEEAVVRPLPLEHLLVQDLEHFEPVHQRVAREVDDPHAAAAQLAEHLVLGVVRELRGERAGQIRVGRRNRSGIARTVGFLRPPGRRRAGGGSVRPGPGIAEPAHEAVARQLGHPLPAGVAGLQMTVDGRCRGIAKLAQAVGVQDLVGRVRRGRSVHGNGLPVRMRRGLTLVVTSGH